MNSFSFAQVFAIIKINMKKSLVFLLAIVIQPIISFARVKGDVIDCPLTNSVPRLGWINVDDEHHLSGRFLTPEDLNTRIVIVQRWCMACPEIDKAVEDFQSLAKHYADTDFIFLSSYFPGAPHQRKDVEESLKHHKVAIPVYIGAASIGVRASREHRALYVVEGGTEEKWCMRINNTDIKALSKYLTSHRDELTESSLRLAATHAPGRALSLAKKLKRSNPKKAAQLKSLIDPLNTPENRQMSDLEDKVDALFSKPNVNPKDLKNMRIKLDKFGENASPALKEEIKALRAALDSISG